MEAEQPPTSILMQPTSPSTRLNPPVEICRLHGSRLCSAEAGCVNVVMCLSILPCWPGRTWSCYTKWVVVLAPSFLALGLPWLLLFAGLFSSLGIISMHLFGNRAPNHLAIIGRGPAPSGAPASRQACVAVSQTTDMPAYRISSHRGPSGPLSPPTEHSDSTCEGPLEPLGWYKYETWWFRGQARGLIAGTSAWWMDRQRLHYNPPFSTCQCLWTAVTLGPIIWFSVPTALLRDGSSTAHQKRLLDMPLAAQEVQRGRSSLWNM